MENERKGTAKVTRRDARWDAGPSTRPILTSELTEEEAEIVYRFTKKYRMSRAAAILVKGVEAMRATLEREDAHA